MWVGQHERIKIRTVGAVPVEGWVTPDARPQGPVFMAAMTEEDVDVRCRSLDSPDLAQAMRAFTVGQKWNCVSIRYY